MRDYIKPFIEDEKIELEDIIAVSGVVCRDSGDLNEEEVGDKYDSTDLF